MYYTTTKKQPHRYTVPCSRQGPILFYTVNFIFWITRESGWIKNELYTLNQTPLCIFKRHCIFSCLFAYRITLYKTGSKHHEPNSSFPNPYTVLQHNTCMLPALVFPAISSVTCHHKIYIFFIASVLVRHVFFNRYGQAHLILSLFLKKKEFAYTVHTLVIIYTIAKGRNKASLRRQSLTFVVAHTV